ncbi:bifunctional 3-deoxy-7-phosphoheptulonate synthase/chorismate mutase [Fictibacillus aquaticus]|uniref:Chorismate mutase n=1 Tax=Fictibacillus aquaticus TaxID=2021314 RepID=A0A235FA66_9BACL|nr:bifunctional 3-deoxy-7-phosphoheptulonate synthase/chorismate mutase [Fictibacillus aquaticus]OYD58230.1 chorismate mutase [Fictibacillus aquaticus]
MSLNNIDKIRDDVDKINLEIMRLINKRANLVQKIGKVKNASGISRFDAVREREMLDLIAANNQGPFATNALQHIFKEIFKAGLEIQEDDHKEVLLVSRRTQSEDTVISFGSSIIGGGRQQIIAGPCAVESYEQTAAAAKEVKKYGLSFLRGGAYKPRTSPYDFQGLGLEGLKILRRAADESGLKAVSEVVSVKDLETASEYLDIIQIGARNMQNFDLLKEAGRMKKPVLLKRGLSATIEEFIYSAEYIISQGNSQIILCERGIRTYERATRNTLDITAVPILKKETHLPVLVDVTHSTGRKDLLVPAAKAAIAIGADGVMAEVHPDPASALSDSAQQMDFSEFEEFMSELTASGLLKTVKETV